MQFNTFVANFEEKTATEKYARRHTHIPQNGGCEISLSKLLDGGGVGVAVVAVVAVVEWRWWRWWRW
jgi:hypothetical protein